MYISHLFSDFFVFTRKLLSYIYMDNELLSLQMHCIIRLVAANYHLHFSTTMLSKPALMQSPNHPSKPRGEINHEPVRPWLICSGFYLTFWGLRRKRQGDNPIKWSQVLRSQVIHCSAIGLLVVYYRKN